MNTGAFLASGGGFNPANPTAVASANLIDADLQAPRTNEIVAGIDREIFPNFAVSLGYTYRKLNRFYTQPRIGMTPADYTAQAAVVGTLPDGTPYSVITYIPNPTLVAAGNSGRFLTNADDYHQTFSGFELSAVKRLSNKWMFRFAGQLQRPHRALGRPAVRGRRGPQRRGGREPDAARRRSRAGRRPGRGPRGGQRHRRRVHQREVGDQRERDVRAPLEDGGRGEPVRQAGHALPRLPQHRARTRRQRSAC